MVVMVIIMKIKNNNYLACFGWHLVLNNQVVRIVCFHPHTFLSLSLSLKRYTSKTFSFSLWMGDEKDRTGLGPLSCLCLLPCRAGMHFIVREDMPCLGLQTRVACGPHAGWAAPVPLWGPWADTQPHHSQQAEGHCTRSWGWRLFLSLLSALYLSGDLGGLMGGTFSSSSSWSQILLQTILLLYDDALLLSS